MQDSLLNDCDLLAGEDEQPKEEEEESLDDEKDKRRKEFIKDSKKRSDDDDDDDEEKTASDWKSVVKALKRLTSEAKPEKKMIAVATASLLVSTVLGLAIPQFFGDILDTASMAAGGAGNNPSVEASAAGHSVQLGSCGRVL